MQEFQSLGKWHISADLKTKFSDGSLPARWMRQYPELFDEDDLRLTVSQPSYHFYEWLAAVMIRESTGWLSLVEKYQFKTHPRKIEIVQRLFGDLDAGELFAALPAQAPDLLMYNRQMTEWYFVEVKGPNDTMRDTQVECFRHLEQVTGKPVKLIEFVWL